MTLYFNQVYHEMTLSCNYIFHEMTLSQKRENQILTSSYLKNPPLRLADLLYRMLFHPGHSI